MFSWLGQLPLLGEHNSSIGGIPPSTVIVLIGEIEPVVARKKIAPSMASFNMQGQLYWSKTNIKIRKVRNLYVHTCSVLITVTEKESEMEASMWILGRLRTIWWYLSALCMSDHFIATKYFSFPFPLSLFHTSVQNHTCILKFYCKPLGLITERYISSYYSTLAFFVSTSISLNIQL